MYPDQICPVCEVTFTPNHKRQIYCSDKCRTKASRLRKRGEGAALELAPREAIEMLNDIRKLDPQLALGVEDLARRAGRQIAEELIFLNWRIMQKASRKLAITDFADLIEEGALEVKRRRRRKST